LRCSSILGGGRRTECHVLFEVGSVFPAGLENLVDNPDDDIQPFRCLGFLHVVLRGFDGFQRYCAAEVRIMSTINESTIELAVEWLARIWIHSSGAAAFHRQEQDAT
jgi:hypothetical protein